MRRIAAATLIFVAVLAGSVFVYRAVFAVDGSGTNLVSPTTATAGSTGNTHAFTYTAAEDASSGEVSIAVPAGWSAPQGSAGSAGYVTATSASGVIANVLNALDSAASWSATNHMALSVDASDKQEGTGSLLNTIGASAAANEQWYFNYGAASNWGGNNGAGNLRVGMWVKSSATAASGDFSWQLDNSANNASPLDTIAIPALVADTWTYTSATLGATTRTSNLSYGFRATTDLGAGTFRADSIAPLFDNADANTNWSEDANITDSALTTAGNFKEGAGAVRCAFAAGAVAGAQCFRTSNTVVTMGPDTTVSFWIRSSVATAAGDLQWQDDNNTTLGSPADTVDLPALSANAWTYVTLTAANSANFGAKSWGFKQVIDLGAFNLDVDAMGKQVDAGDSTTGWTAPTAGIQTLSADTSVFHENGASLKNIITAAAGAGDKWYQTLGSAQDWSGYTTVGVWIRSTVATTAGQLKFEYGTASDLSTTIASINVGALSANTWSYQTFALSGTRTSVSSFGINYATDIGAATVYLDDFLIGPGVPTFPGGGIIKTRLLSLTSGQTAVITYGSGGGSSGATAPTASGVSTFTTQSRVSDSGTLTDISSSPTITVNPDATSQFTVNDPGNITAGTRAAYVVTRKDQFSNLVTSGAQTVYLYSDSTGTNDAFYNVSSGGTPVASVTIADTASTANFWYYDDAATTATVTTSDNATAPDGTTNIDDATDSITVSAAATSQFSLDDPGNMTAGTRLGYVVTRKDAFGNVTTSGAQTVYLYSDSSGSNDVFYAASSGGSPIASVSIADTASTANVWYYDDFATVATVTASDNATAPDGLTGIDDATDVVTVSADATSQFSLNDPGNMTAGTRLGYVVTRKDQFGNATTSGAQTVYLYSDSSGSNDVFYAASSGGSPIASVSILDTASTANFWYYDDLATTATVTASDNATSPDGATGIDDAADSVTVSADATAQFSLDDPGNTTAGVRLGYVVTRKDAFGNLVTSGAQTVYLYSDSPNSPAFFAASSGGSPIASISILDAASTANFWYYDEAAGTATVTASDNATAPDGTTGIDDATDSVTIGQAATSQFTLNDPGDIVAGTRAAYTVTRKDSFGNPVTSGSDTVYLYSDSTGNKAFYDAASGGTVIASATISNGFSSVNVWYYDDKAGTFTVTASDNATAPDGTTGIDDATDGITISAAAASQFLLNDPGNMTAGTRLGYVVTRKDAFNNLVTSGAQTVYLYSSSTGANKAFYAASSGGSPIAFVSIADAASTANFWYYDELAGTFTVTASDNATAPDGATGIVDAADGVTVSADATSQFLLDDPGNMTAGTRLGYVVTRKDQFGNATTSGAQTVYLYSSSTGTNKAFYAASSGGSPILSVSIADTVSTANFWYYDDLATSATVTASDNAISPDGATGIVDATDSVTVSADATSQFLLDDPGNMTAGTRLGYVVTRKDQFGNATISGAQTVYLYSDSTGNEAFYAASSGGTPILSVSIADAASSANFWYYDDKAGTFTVTSSDNATFPDGTTGIDDAADGVTVSAAATSQFLLDDPGGMAAGTRLGYVVTRKDAFGNLVTSGAQTVYLYSDSANSPAFFAASSGGSPIASVSILDAASTANFWYYDEAAGTATVTASDNATAPDGTTGIDDATDSVTVTQAATSQFALNDPGDIVAGTRAAYTVTRKDSFGNPTTSGSDTVYLYSDSTGNKAFYDASSGGTVIASVTISEGFSSASFWYYDDKAGTFTVTASDNATAPDGAAGIDDATDGITISAAATSQFLLDDPGNMTAGTRLGYVVTRKDAFGNLATSGADTVYLYSDSTGNEAFYAASSGGTPIASVSIADTASTANFWYYDDLAGTFTVTASDNATAPDGAAGIDDASDGVTVSAAAAAQFSLNDPGNMTAGTRLGYVVTRRDAFGNLVTSGVETVYLYSDSANSPAFYVASSGGSPVASVSISDAASTANFWYYDELAGSATVTASDNATAPDGTTGIDDATDGVTVIAAATSQFTLNDPGGMAAGTRLGYTVTRKDAFGNLAGSGAQTVYLYSDSTGNKAFYDASSGGNVIASIDIFDGFASANFWYEDDLAGTFTVTASDNATAPDGTTGIDDATDSITVSAASASQFLLDDPGSVAAGTRLGYVVTRKDQFNNLVTSGAQTVYLYSDSANSPAFYAASTGGSPVASVSISDASSTASFWYYDELAGSATVTASDNATAPDATTGIDDATDGVTVVAGETRQFFLGDPGDMTAGTRLGYTVTRKDAFGNLSTSGTDTAYLYSDSTGNEAFYDASSGGSVIASVAFADGFSTAGFWYYDDKAGTFTVTASDNATSPDGVVGIDDATDGVTVSAASAAQFFLDDPGNMTAGTRLGYVVTRKDAFGNLVTSGAQSVYLYSSSVGSNKAFYNVSSGGSPVALVSIADTASTAGFWYYDELVTDATITVSDNVVAPDGTDGIDDAADGVTISAAAASQFLLNDPGDTTAGERLGYVVTRKDAFGNVVASGTQTVYLYSDSANSPAFYAADVGGSPVASVTIADAASTANFWYYDEATGTVTVTASDNATAPDGATGIDDATDVVVIGQATASQFVLNDPGDITAGTRAAYTVTRKDPFGNATTAGAQTVYLYSDSTGNEAFYDAASGGSVIASATILDGFSSVDFWYYDDKAGTFTVTASDNATAPDGTTGIDDGTDGITISAAATSQFSLNDPGGMTAGTRLGYVVTRKDAFGNATSSGAQTVYLYSTSAGSNKAFYAASSGGSPIASVSIADTSSTASFWYHDELATTATIAASDNATAPDGTDGIDDATDGVTVSADATRQFLLSDPGDMVAGTRLGYVVSREDQFGNFVTSGTDTVYLYSDSTGNPAFFATSSGGSPVPSIGIGDGFSSANFWYYDDKAGTFAVTASDNAASPDGVVGIDDATDSVTVTFAATAQFSLDDPGDMTAGTRLGYVVTRKDAFGNVVTSGIDGAYLYSDSTGNQEFFDASSGGSAIASVDIANGNSTASFWYYDDKAGSSTVTASDSAFAPDAAVGIDDATDSVSVSAADTAQFSLSDPGSVTAGTRLGYVVTRKDAFGNLATSGAQTVYLYGDSANSPSFFAASSGGIPVASVSIPDASSTANFWYYDELAGSATVTASDNATAPDGTTSVDDATDSVAVTAAATSEFSLSDPGGMTAGTRLGYVVTRRDAFGNLVVTGAETVYLYSDSANSPAFFAASSGGSPVASISIADAASTASFWYYDELAGNATVTASDNATAPDGATSVDDASDAVAVTAAATAQFVLDDPGSTTAGERLGYVVTRRDAFGNLVVSGADTVYLYGNSTGNYAFYDASSGGSPVASVTILAASSTASFWYYDDTAGTFDVTASDNATAPDGTTGVDDATDAATVVAAATAQFSLNDPGDTTAGERIGYVVSRRDAFGNLVSSGVDAVSLYSDSAGNPAFYAASAGGSPIASIDIPAASSSAAFWYYDEATGTATVTASDNAAAPDGAAGIDDATDLVVVDQATTSQFLLNDPGDIVAGSRAAYTVTRKDPFGNLVTSGDDTVRLYSDSTGNEAFYDASSGGIAIGSVTIPDGFSSASFWYYDDKVGAFAVTASDNAVAPDGAAGIDDATDGISVSAAAVSQFLLSDPGDMAAGDRLGYVVTRKDAFGNMVISGAQTVYLYGDSAGSNKAFYDVSSGGTPVLSVEISDTESVTAFWYYDDLATTATVTASDSASAPDGATGIDDATDGVTIAAAATSKFALNDPGDMTTGTRLGYVVTRRDAFDNLVTVGTDTAYPYSDSTGSYAFYNAATAGSIIFSVIITEGNSTGEFWYYEEQPGTITITASDNAIAPDGAAGIDDATDLVVVTMPTPVRFVIVQPADTDIETPAEITVRAEDGDGALASGMQDDVTLNADGSATGAGLVDIVNGIGTIQISDPVIEVVHLSLTDSEGTGLDVSSTKNLNVTVGPTRQFALNDPGDMTAGTRIGYEIARKDASGNPVTAGTDTVYLYADSTGNYAFYDVSSGGSPVASVDVTDGNSTAAFWYYDDKAATVSVTASDNETAPDGTSGTDDASDVVLVSAAATSEFQLNDPGDMTAGTRLGYEVTRRDQFGNLVTAGSELVYLYTDSTGNALFFDAAVDGNQVTQIAIGDGSSVGAFWYYDDKVASVTVTASDNASAPDGTGGINDAVDSPAISAAAIARFVLDDPGNMTVGTRVGYVVTRKDAFGNLVSAGSDTAYLYATSSGIAPAFYDAAVDGNEISSVDIGDGFSTASFWYFDDTAGTWDITASDNASAPDGDGGVDDGTDSLVVTDIPIVATRFVILDPTDGTAGDAISVTVRAEDDFGSVDTTYQGDVTLAISGSGTGGGLVDIVNGVGLRDVSDTVAEEVTLSLADTEGTGLLVGSVRNLAFATGPTARFALSDPGDTTAGTRIAYEATRADEFGNLVTVGSETAYLYSEAGSPATFFDASSGGSQISSVAFADGSATAAFWYVDEQAVEDTVTVSDNGVAPDDIEGIEDGTDAVVISAGPTSAFLLSDPGDMSVDTRVAYSVTREDAFGNLVTAGAETAYLFTTSAETSPAFYDAASDGNAIVSVELGDGFSAANFWYFDDTAGTWDVTASDNPTAPDANAGVDDGTDSIVVTEYVIVATKFVILDPDNGTVGDTITVTVRAEDDFGSADTTYQADVTLVLSGSAIGGGLVDIVNGIGTMSVSDAAPETVTLSLSDTEGTGLDVTSTREMTFESTGDSGGGGGGGTAAVPEATAPEPTVLRFDGTAYPGATVTLLGNMDDGTSASLEQVVVGDAGGTFSIEYAGPFEGILSYDISISDPNGLVAPPIPFAPTLVPNVLTTLTLFAAPTMDLLRYTVLRGLSFTAVGYASPGSLVQLSVDGADPTQIVRVNDDGSYRLVLETLALDFGSHVLRTRQVSDEGVASEYGPSRTVFVSRLLNRQTDLNGDDAIDIADWSIFLVRWSSMDEAIRSLLDFNGDGTIDIADFSIFIRSIRH